MKKRLNPLKSWMWMLMCAAVPLVWTGCEDAGDEMEDAVEDSADAVEDAAEDVTDGY